jgi:UDP-N-acetylglucosamine/UDP-N-acetylgalactosamine 4-epimerase
VYNVAVGGRLSLNELAQALRELIVERHPARMVPLPTHGAFRDGDVRHSQADIAKAERLLGYAPTHDVRAGLRAALPWYEAQSAPVGELDSTVR